MFPSLIRRLNFSSHRLSWHYVRRQNEILLQFFTWSTERLNFRGLVYFCDTQCVITESGISPLMMMTKSSSRSRWNGVCSSPRGLAYATGYRYWSMLTLIARKRTYVAAEMRRVLADLNRIPAKPSQFSKLVTYRR